ncbi:hypothetical protein C8F01DRAFT_312143 [Mycena amicta]|nr:hypothetical protein C8F01DRAFT_312143 [Mycena amicta]
MPSRTTTTTIAAAGSGSGSGSAKLRVRRGTPRVAAAAAVARTPEPPAFPDVDENDAVLVATGTGPLHLNDPWAYTFKPNEHVWIRHHDKWISGRIFPRSVPKIRSTDNLTYWNVLYQDAYGHKLRRCFSPLLGELKPDTPRIRRMLRAAHWI